MSQTGPVSVRSYRRVFDLERRLHHRHAPPGGIPLRALAYAAVAASGALVAGALPPLSLVAVAGPLRAGIAGTVGFALSIARPQGRLVHHCAAAILGHLAGPRALVALRAAGGGLPYRFEPTAVLLIPDGSEPRLRALRYRGPGVVAIHQSHRRSEHARLLRGVAMTVTEHPLRHRLAVPSVLAVHDGAALEVRR